MSYRPHPTMNKSGGFPDQYGQQWWYVEIWPNGRKRGPNGKLVGERVTGSCARKGVLVRVQSSAP
jgi:hypothetical protein